MTQNTSINIPTSLLTALLVVVESALSLILRFDAKLRQTAYPLAQSETLVCIRSYVPHEEVYVTFTFKGVLIDTQLASDKKPDVVINAYSFQILTSLFSNKQATIDKLQFRGDATKVAQVKAFLLQLSVASLVEMIKDKTSAKTHKNNNKHQDNQNSESTNQNNNNEKNHTNSDNKNKIQQLYQQLDSVTIENKKLSTQVKELQNKQKLHIYALIIIFAFAIISFFV